MKKILTFITTIYNTELPFLESLFDSFGHILNDERLEFIIIDDCSLKKDSILYLSQRFENNANFKLHIMKRNSSRVGAFQKGIELSSGKYIQSLDSDDLVDSKSIEKLLIVLNSLDDNVSRFIINSWYERDYFSKDINLSTYYNGNVMEHISEYKKNIFYPWSVFSAYNTIVSGELARSIDYSEIIKGISLPHDDALFCQAWLNKITIKNTLSINEPFFIYNINQPWTTGSGSSLVSKRIKIHWKLCKRIIKLYDKNNPLTAINISSILLSHFKGLSKKNKWLLLPFWIKVKFILPSHCKRNKFYRNSAFRKGFFSGINIFYNEK